MSFFKLEIKDIKIEENKISTIVYNNKIFLNHADIYNKIKFNKDKDIQYIRKNFRYNLLNEQSYIFEIFDMYNNYGYLYYPDNENYNGNIIINDNIKLKDIKNKYDNIISTLISKKHMDLYWVISDCKKRDEFMLKINLEKIHDLYDCLNINGNVLISLNNIGLCSNETIEFIYLFTSLFEYSIILNGDLLFGYKFNPKIKQEEIKKLYNKHFNIEPKKDLTQLIEYMNNYYLKETETLKLLLNKKEDEYLFERYNKTSNMILTSTFINETIKKNIIVKLKLHLINYFKKIFLENKKLKVHSNIKLTEGNYLIKIINDNNFKECLEIGMAYGVSATYMLSIKDVKLTSIDPFQTTQWKSSGLELLKSLKFEKNHKLFEEKSYDALPALLKDNKVYDFIFIDGWHTFDYTLIDFFYADKLIKKGGVIVIDDALHPGVRKFVDYINTNYKWYKKLDSPITLASYEKIKEDDREWNFHKNF